MGNIITNESKRYAFELFSGWYMNQHFQLVGMTIS